MESSRYGDLEDIAAHTDGNCHLCHQPADLDLYGRTGLWGEDTVTVDHLWPQSWGGSDEIDNLRLAHGTCNSRRGTRDIELVRTELAGLSRAPLSSGEKTAWSIAGGGTAALLAGYGFAQQGPDGSPQFNTGAAILTGLLVGCFLRSAL